MTAVVHDATAVVNVGWFVVRMDRQLRAAVSQRTGLFGDELNEVMAEAVCRALEQSERTPFYNEGQCFTWIVRVAHRIGIDELRHRRRFHLAGLHDLDGTDLAAASDPTTAIEEAEVDRAARASLAALPERQRRILQADLAGLSNASIAKHHHMTEGAVESALHRARRALWREFARRFGPFAVFAFAWRRLRNVQMTSPMAAAGLAAFLVVAPLGRVPLRPDNKLTGDASGRAARVSGVVRDPERIGDDSVRDGHDRSAPSPIRSPKLPPSVPELEVQVCADRVCAGTGRPPPQPGEVFYVLPPGSDQPIYVTQDYIPLCGTVPDTPVSGCRPHAS